MPEDDNIGLRLTALTQDWSLERLENRDPYSPIPLGVPVSSKSVDHRGNLKAKSAWSAKEKLPRHSWIVSASIQTAVAIMIILAAVDIAHWRQTGPTSVERKMDRLARSTLRPQHLHSVVINVCAVRSSFNSSACSIRPDTSTELVCLSKEASPEALQRPTCEKISADLNDLIDAYRRSQECEKRFSIDIVQLARSVAKATDPKTCSKYPSCLPVLAGTLNSSACVLDHLTASKPLIEQLIAAFNRQREGIQTPEDGLAVFGKLGDTMSKGGISKEEGDKRNRLKREKDYWLRVFDNGTTTLGNASSVVARQANWYLTISEILTAFEREAKALDSGQSDGDTCCTASNPDRVRMLLEQTLNDIAGTREE
jgi:hypothetical protein